MPARSAISLTLKFNLCRTINFIDEIMQENVQHQKVRTLVIRALGALLNNGDNKMIEDIISHLAQSKCVNSFLSVSRGLSFCAYSVMILYAS